MTKDHAVCLDLPVFLAVDEALPVLPDPLDQEDCPEFRASPEKTDTKVNSDPVVSRVLPEDRVFQDRLVGRDLRARREIKATPVLRDCPVWMDPRGTPAPLAPRENQAPRGFPVSPIPESRAWTVATVWTACLVPKERGDREENEVLLVTP